ncbi:MAG: endonuclease/exonuclease/phosphatase family protein [bacterium]|nr:endonuclease/exonuclease/phosphatase family protein [bacterium]
MKELIICSYNVRNDNLLKDKDSKYIEEIYHRLTKENKIQILATQEMVSSTLKILRKSLKSYHVVGNYRYGKSKLVRSISYLDKYNEANNIITNLPVLTAKTTELPWFPRNLKELYNGLFKYKTITPRIMTEAILDIENYGRIRVINTHLSVHLRGINRLQLKKLKKKIESSTIPVILMGDFNTNIKDKAFQKFITEVECYDLKRIDFNGSTFKKHKRRSAIDHIFIPTDWQVVEVKTINDSYLDDYSDHFPLLAKIIVKK